ncbi:type I restriction endonuclease subunit R [Candidatus Chloroploca sp. M-50]|uniref:Type I restriction enzyme endonuclease subunit n=1 Tax=Candidatus Chloroploca mongolica TaxID=2528176 RepID=A0ABS4DA01_9CHLR|nr:type I restriction endonuclease subunit R [Candidatus Chloroploca mongolica]MBP1466239.1 type I restriction endonuclease subunit R [Candidatus Chloroploca mongolica]
MPHHNLDSEDALERETMALFQALGWKTTFALHEWDTGASTLGRETMADVILAGRLRPALERLNPDLPDEALTLAIDELFRDRSALSAAAANREIYRLLKDGVLVTLQSDEGEERIERVRGIDWQQADQNDFLLVSQFWVSGEYGKKRADLVGFVNGLPLVLLELKAHHKHVQAAYDNNLRDYKTTIPQLFWPNALIILSNGVESRVGSMTAEWNHFSEWKRINSEGEKGVVSLDTTVRATCAPERLLDLVENFTLFEETRGGLVKLIARNHQYLGVNNAIAAVRDLGANQGRLGVFWHTQGSGKSYSMVFFAQKILRALPGNWTFLVVTDRLDLDEQIYKNFARVGAVTEPEESVRAGDGVHLRQLLREDHRYLFTLIQKFRTEGGEPYPQLSERSDIIVMTDEAHRSQYDIFAQNMRQALPRAAFIGFTGTPLIVGEEKTREVFGDYVSIYNFRQSVEDRATVPLYYENRIPEVQIVNEHLNEDMGDLLDAAMLDEAQEQRLEQEFRHEYQVITRDERLETVARDIVAHFMGRGYRGKAMVVAIDKLTAVRMYDKVYKYWQSSIADLQSRLSEAISDESDELEKAIAFMQTTDMAVVISPSQNEIDIFAKRGMEIASHRKRIVNEDLDTKFKDPNDSFRIVFVCAMWMTGFDVPSCSTIYLDKPMRNHTLMQTIARANRVFKDKQNGLIVDYIGVFRSLQQALVIYGSGSGGGIAPGDMPVRDKAAQRAELRQVLDEATAFCAARGVDLNIIAAADNAFQRIALVSDAVEAIIVNDDQKQQFLNHANTVDRLFRAILPDQSAAEFQPTHAALTVIAHRIRALAAPADIENVMDQVGELLDDSVLPKVQYTIRDQPYRRLGEDVAQADSAQPIDLSAIDFGALRQKFETGRKRTEAEQLRSTISRKLTRMVRLNKTRMNYLEQFQRLVNEYNAGAANVEGFFAELVTFAANLNAEEQRAIAEQLEEEELALFDLLTRPEVTPTKAEADQIKQVARDLLTTLKREKLVLDWRKKQQARAAVRVTIEDMLDQLPDLYSKELYEQKCQVVYQHVYESYLGQGKSIYSRAA